MPAFNLHSLLDSTVYATTYLDRLTLSSDERDEMQSARTEIRDRLRSKRALRTRGQSRCMGDTASSNSIREGNAFLASRV